MACILGQYKVGRAEYVLGPVAKIVQIANGCSDYKQATSFA